MGHIFYGLPAGWISGAVPGLAAAGRYRLVFDDHGSRVLARRP